MLVAAVLLVSACGTAVSSTPLAPPSPPTGALAAWQDFRANAKPRPIVWFSVPNLMKGFPNDDRKIAWTCNKMALADGLKFPETAPARATATWPSGVTASYQAMPAGNALPHLKAPPGGSTDCARVQPLVITTIRYDTASFGTDRGFAQMSAWLFDTAYGSYAYPALDPSAYWQGGMVTSGSVGGRASPDGKTLTLSLVGGPDTPGPCGVDYSASVAESDTAVAVAIASRIHGGGSTTFCDLVGYSRTVMVRLARPIGGRVLLDAVGNAGDVI
jgi:hypothetical protein